MFRAGIIAIALWCLLFVSEQAEVWAKQPKIGDANARGTQQETQTLSGFSSREWLWQMPSNTQTYYYYPASQDQADKGAEAFLGIGADLWVAIFTLALVTTTIVQVWLILRAENLTRAALRVSQRQSIAAKKANEFARKFFIEEHRPWVRPIGCYVVTGLEPDRETGGLKISVGVTFKNVGKSPALDLWYAIEMDITQAMPEPIREQLYEDVKSGKLRKFPEGAVVFPGDEIELAGFADLSKSRLSQCVFKHSFVEIHGCVSYKYSGDDVRRYTQFSLFLKNKAFVGPTGQQISLFTGPIMPADLDLIVNKGSFRVT